MSRNNSLLQISVRPSVIVHSTLYGVATGGYEVRMRTEGAPCRADIVSLAAARYIPGPMGWDAPK
jgi:uncharacterized protein YqfA (UPF0365 family)